MNKTYALLVGIDNYPAPVPQLRGCANDIAAIKEYLETRGYKDLEHGEDALHLTVFLNHEATREAIVNAFRRELCQADQQDVVLFYYSGHGSQEQTPEVFWPLEPDRLDETLVLYDSRTEGGWDLADKELAKLLHEVSSNGAQVVVILDCCHSGSGTRAPIDMAIRRVKSDLRTRPIESFIFGQNELSAIASPGDLMAQPSGWNLTGRHVLFAACRDNEEAVEYVRNGITRGVFSYLLEKSLREISNKITYRDLFAHVATLVRCQGFHQSPQLEATHTEDLTRPFLGGVIAPISRHFVVSYQNNRWMLDAGLVHGLPISTPSEPIELALFAYDSTEEALQQINEAIGRAVIKVSLSSSSVIEFVDGLVPPNMGPYKAVLASVPTPRMKVSVQGDTYGVQLAREAINSSLFVREIVEKEEAVYQLVAYKNQYLLVRASDERSLVEPIDGYSTATARDAIEQLERIERWQTTMELDNQATSIHSDEVQIDVLQDGMPIVVSDLRFTYVRDDGGQWLPPEITIRVRNNGTRTLYVGLLDLPETFGIFPLLDVGSQRLESGQETVEPLTLTIPDHFWKRGISELRDVIKVIVSTTEFDIRRLGQGDLGASTLRSVDTIPPARFGTFDRLLERIQTRHAGKANPRQTDDWRTFQFPFTIIRPLMAARMNPNQAVQLMDGVRIEPHRTFSADAVRLSSSSVAYRASNTLTLLPRLLYDDPAVIQPFAFNSVRALGDVLNVIEMDGITDFGAVTESNPLKIIVPKPLLPSEHVLPVGFDGEFFLPLGRSETLGSETVLILERLPNQGVSDSRTLSGSLRILFYKVVCRVLGTYYPYPILAISSVDEHFNVRYDCDQETIRFNIRQAKRIALFVHGITGDTRAMAASLARAGVADQYDLILTFDYENLHDPIPETARALKRCFENVGLKPQHDKALDVIAHSMGGLVARWFIEREGGNEMVQRLIMFGTPNGGSPWSVVEDWATATLAIGLNGLSKAFWPASVIAGLVTAIEIVDVTLDQMAPDSLFLRELYASPDPHIPYTLISGNTRLISMGQETERRSKIERLVRLLQLDRTKYEIANLVFDGSDNDMAVSVSSVQHLSPDRIPAFAARTIACDHVAYFEDPVGLECLRDVV